MPNIDSIPVEFHEPTSSYHHIEDNRPLRQIVEQLEVINDQVDLNNADLVSAIGSQGSLSNRLNQSLNQNGSLKTAAIDEALHSIEEHSDTTDYVRMTSAERAKLVLVASNATSLAIDVETNNVGTVSFENTTLIVEESDSITWSYTGGKLSAETNFPSSVRHNHYYGLVPVTVNYLNYTTTSIATAYKEGSLRVYVNGIRLNENAVVSVPFSLSGTITWISLKYTEGTATSGIVTGGNFSLSTTIASSANVVIDFDVLYS